MIRHIFADADACAALSPLRDALMPLAERFAAIRCCRYAIVAMMPIFVCSLRHTFAVCRRYVHYVIFAAVIAAITPALICFSARRRYAALFFFCLFYAR